MKAAIRPIKETVVLSLFVILLAGCALPDRSTASPNPSPSEQSSALRHPIKLPDGSEVMPANPPKTVLDFWALLPSQSEKKEYQEQIKLYDPDMNFLETEVVMDGGDWKGGYQLKLFRKQAGGSVLGIIDTVSLLSEEHSGKLFLEYQKGKWLDVSAKIVPNYGADDPEMRMGSPYDIYKFSRESTTVEVFQGAHLQWAMQSALWKGEKRYDLIWQGDRFVIAR